MLELIADAALTFHGLWY